MSFLTTPQDSTPDGNFLFPVCTDRETLRKILSVLYFGIFEAGYGDDPTVMFPILEAMAFMQDPENAPCVSVLGLNEASTTDDIKKAFASLGVDVCAIENDCEEYEDNMANCLKPVNIGGNWFAQLDCGCAEALFFELTPVAVDSNGNPISGESGGTVQDSWGFQVGSGNLTCYQADATDYLLDRAVAFSEAVIDFTANVIDWASPLDETVDSIELASNILFGTGDLPEIGSLLKTAVSDALKDPAVGTPLAEAWNFTGTVTKSNLYDWVKAAPNTFNGIIVRAILENWIDGSLLIGLNRGLRNIAAQCESGAELPDGFPLESTLLQTYDWAHVYDLRDAAFTDDAWFSYRQQAGQGVDLGQWIDGQGLVAIDDALAPPHAQVRLDFDIEMDAVAGSLAYLAVDYQYAQTTDVANESHDIAPVFGTPSEVDFDGIYERDDLAITANGIRFTFTPTQVNNTNAASGGIAVVRRIAVAGTGSDLYASLSQV